MNELVINSNEIALICKVIYTILIHLIFLIFVIKCVGLKYNENV